MISAVVVGILQDMNYDHPGPQEEEDGFPLGEIIRRHPGVSALGGLAGVAALVRCCDYCSRGERELLNFSSIMSLCLVELLML